jgi:hypothetical protein
MGSKKDQDAIDEAIAMAMDSMYEDKIMLPDEPDMGVKNKRGDSSRFMRSEKAKDRALERRARDSASRTIDGFMGWAAGMSVTRMAARLTAVARFRYRAVNQARLTDNG